MTINTNTHIPTTPAAFGAYIADLIRGDFPDPLAITNRVGAPIRSFVDLHQIVDANEYLIDAEEHFGVDVVALWETAEGVDAFNEFETKAVLHAHRLLGW